MTAALLCLLLLGAHEYPMLDHRPGSNDLELDFWRVCAVSFARIWYGTCVCLSVHKACKHDTDWTVPARTFKFGTLTTYDKRTNPIDFQGQGSKVKVTFYTLLLNLVNKIQTEPFQLGPSNLVYILLMTRGRHLLISKVRGQRSRSHVTHCF